MVVWLFLKFHFGGLEVAPGRDPTSLRLFILFYRISTEGCCTQSLVSTSYTAFAPLSLRQTSPSRRLLLASYQSIFWATWWTYYRNYGLSPISWCDTALPSSPSCSKGSHPKWGERWEKIRGDHIPNRTLSGGEKHSEYDRLTHLLLYASYRTSNSLGKGMRRPHSFASVFLYLWHVPGKSFSWRVIPHSYGRAIFAAYAPTSHPPPLA